MAENYGLRSGELSTILERIEEHQDEITTRGMNTSEPEVIRISKEEIWLSFQGRELCLPFEHFPWFKDAAAAAIKNVHLIHQDHLHWPDLDVDLSLESIECPYRFPLVAN